MFFLVYVFSLCVFSYAVADASTEATAPCLDRLSCADSDPSLSRLVESIPEAPCPKFIIEQQVLRDSKSSLTTDSPDEICTGVATSSNHFKNASELESYLRQSPHFSNLNQAFPPFSICLSQGVSVPIGLGKTSVALSKETLPENKKKLAVAEYYSSLRRLSDGLGRSLQNITAIDLMIGNSLLSDVSCNNLDSISTVQAGQCRSVKQCPINSNNNPQLMRESAQDTLLALQGIEAIEKEIKRIKFMAQGPVSLGGPGGISRKNRDKIQELRERQQSLQNLYPWVLGKKFKDGYRQEDYIGYANSSEAGKREMESQVAGLIREQLSHTRAKLKERKEDFIKASSCIKKEESFCDELDIPKILATAPPINHTEIFARDRREELKNKMEEKDLTLEERTEYRRLLTQVGEADGLFELVGCLQTQRKAVKDVNKELALGALDVGIVVGTMGIGSVAMAGKLALRIGGTLSKAEKLSKAKRLQNLGIFGTDVSLSAPYMQEAMNVCEDQINQLEEMQETEETANAQQTANTEQTTNAEQTANKNKDCKKLPVRAKHTSDVKACLLQASLASLPITLPILGLSGMALAKKLRNTPTSSPTPFLNSSGERAEEVLEIKLSPSQRSAVEEAHLVGQGERGRNGAIAGIGNYTEDQLRRKAEILRRAGFSSSQRRKLMEAGVVGILKAIRRRKVQKIPIEELRNLNFAQLAKLPPRDTALLSKDQIQALGGKIRRFTKEQTQALNVQHLSTNQLLLLNVEHLTEKQLKKLGRNIIYLSNTKTIQALGSKIRYLTKDQLQVLPVQDLTRNQIQILENKIRFFTDNQIQALPAQYLTEDQLQALGDKTRLFTENQLQTLGHKIRFLTENQLQTLGNKITLLTEDQIRSLPAQYLTNTQLQALGDKIRHLNLSDNQIQNLNVQDFDIGQIQALGGKIRRFTKEQTQVLNVQHLSTNQLLFLNVEHLTKSQIQSLGSHIKSFFKEQTQALGDKIKHLTKDQLQILPVQYLTRSQTQALGNEGIETLTRNQIRRLNVQDLTKEQTQALGKNVQELTEDQIRRLNVQDLTINQIQALGDKTRLFIEDQIQNLNVQNFGIEHIKILGKNIQKLTEDQIQTLDSNVRQFVENQR